MARPPPKAGRSRVAFDKRDNIECIFASPPGEGLGPCILRDSRLLAHPEAASNCSSLRVSFAPNRASATLAARLPPAPAEIFRVPPRFR